MPTLFCLLLLMFPLPIQDVEGSLAGYVQHSDMLYKLWGELETAVLTGTNCWQPAFGLSGSDVFASLYQDDAAVLRFMRGMDGFSQLSARAVLTAFDLAQFKNLVDLGGATGALAAAACSIYPEMKAVVIDMPHVIDKALQHFSQRPAALVRVPDGVSHTCVCITPCKLQACNACWGASML